MTSVSVFRQHRGLGYTSDSKHVCPKPCSAQCGQKAIQVTSGIAVALCLQLNSPINARANEEMIAVPRGALEDLIVRDIASRVHSMDAGALATFLDSLRSVGAPELTSSSPPTSRAQEAKASGSTSRQPALEDSPVQTELPHAPERAKSELQGRSLGNTVTLQSSAAGEPSQPELSIPATTASSPSPDTSQDFTAELLGIREQSLEVDSRASRAGSAVRSLVSSLNALAGLPVAIWTFLDTMLPEPLQPGQELTEEVQRAVLATKGIVLIVSSTLAYFLARALLQQLIKAATAIPLLRSVADGSRAVADGILKRGEGASEAAVPQPSEQTDTPLLGSQQATPRQRNEKQSAGSPSADAEQSNGFSSVRRWAQRAAAALPGSLNPAEDSEPSTPTNLSTSSAARPAAVEPSEPADRFVGSGKRQDSTVPLFPTPQAAMLSVTGSMQQARGQSKRFPRGSNSTGSEASRVELFSSDDRGRNAQGPVRRARRGLDANELAESDRGAPDAKGGVASGPGVLWKRRAAVRTLSDKWADSRESAESPEAPTVSGARQDSAITDDLAPHSRVNDPGRDRSGAEPAVPGKLSSDALNRVGETADTVSGSAAGESGFADGRVAEESLRENSSMLGHAAEMAQTARVHNGVHPQGNSLLSSSTGASEDLDDGSKLTEIGKSLSGSSENGVMATDLGSGSKTDANDVGKVAGSVGNPGMGVHSAGEREKGKDPWLQ